MKQCAECGITKNYTCFEENQYGKDGYLWRCKDCQEKRKLKRKEKEKRASADHYQKNKEKIKVRSKAYYWANKDKCMAAHRKYYEKNREANLIKFKAYRDRTKEERLPERRKWWSENSKKMSEERKAAYAANPDKYRKQKLDWYYANHEKNKKSMTDKYANDPRHKISARVRVGIYKSIKENKAGRHWESLVDYTLGDLMKHLSKQFQPGMSWDNMGEWHIDHIIPITAFSFSKSEDLHFQEAWALKNLRPLWAVDNLKKKNKIEKTFQQSLPLTLP
jgi:hypothetical protein